MEGMFIQGLLIPMNWRQCANECNRYVNVLSIDYFLRIKCGYEIESQSAQEISHCSGKLETTHMHDHHHTHAPVLNSLAFGGALGDPPSMRPPDHLRSTSEECAIVPTCAAICRAIVCTRCLLTWLSFLGRVGRWQTEVACVCAFCGGVPTMV